LTYQAFRAHGQESERDDLLDFTKKLLVINSFLLEVSFQLTEGPFCAEPNLSFFFVQHGALFVHRSVR
jgi:hypothetical protein